MAEVTEASFELEGLLSRSIRRFAATERLSEPYSVTLVLEHEDPSFDVAGALGKDATLLVEQEGMADRRFPGLVWGVASTDGERASGRDTAVELTLRPALQLMSLNQTSRIFQHKSVPEILEELLDAGLAPHGRSYTMDLRGTYRPREYCVQYQESDLDFVQRLMAEEGIFYGFDFEAGPERLIVRDGNHSFVELPDSTLLFAPEEGRVAPGPSVTHFVRRRGSATNAVALHDWDWTGPRNVTAERATESVLPTLESYEHGRGRSVTITDYDEGARRYQSDNVTDQARVRSEAKRVGDDVGIGRSGMAQLYAGGKLALAGHPVVGVDGEYVLTEVVHRFGEGGGRGYEALFRCIPSDTPFRPQPRRKPVIHSVQTATVVGPSGEEIHIDAHGRIVVQFHWDREGENNERSSCWIRVRQAWAGDGWGFLFVPRIGMEVVVTFLGGDPDRPLVTACVYNGDNPPPYALPGEKTKSTIKTNSSKGGGGFNEYRFEDKAGSEQIYIHAQKDFNEVVENCHSTWVGGNQTNKVKKNQTQEIGDWQKETVDIDQTMTVTGKRTVEVGATFTETIDTGETRTVSGGSKEEIEAGELRTIVGPMTETVSGGETRTVKGGLAELIVGAFERNVTGGDALLQADGPYSKTVTGALTVTTPGSMSFTAQSGVVIDAGGPITATGGPFIEVISVNETRVTKVEVKYGVFKLSGYGTKVTNANLSVGIVNTSRSVTLAKAEAYAVKVDIGAVKLDVTGIKVEGTVLYAGCGADTKKNKFFWFK